MPFFPPNLPPLLPLQQDAAPKIKIVAQLDEKLVGERPFLVTLTDSAGKPVLGAKVSVSLAMTNMDMGTTRPKFEERPAGVYATKLAFSMAGPWRATVRVESGAIKLQKAFDYKIAQPKEDGADDASMPGTNMHGMEMSGMKMSGMMGKLGPWPMTKEGSGTSWLPESSPMFMKSLPDLGRYSLSVMGFATLNYSDAGGPRGNGRFYSNSMPMLMARRDTGGGTIGINLMGSLDPVFNGQYGYPNLFQTGETAHGKFLNDYQHPHDLLSELTISYSRPIGGGVNAFVYGGPVGEPALGGPTFAHRPSGMDVPEAPISHHWFDSTHISWGVVTLGLNSARWQIEGSAFNGHEPDEDRYTPDSISLNSASGRLTYNPTKRLSFNASYGFLDSPEATEPGENQHRMTAAAIYSLPLSGGDNLSFTAAYGRNATHHGDSEAKIFEGTYYRGRDSLFFRYENVDKDELVGVPDGSYRVDKLLFGGIKNLTSRGGFDLGLGGYAGVYGFPSALDPYYGRSPVTLGIFLRLRPSQMRHEM